ncbi:DUF4097 family beta strand repeat-containing protein [Promicromonospora thailandica]|uniref:Adhesin n=1 Tax=Promicromonospora thailandica TaxID=765201 RepID=A0A9X2G4K6_9MICO|nr:DUF4097 family beta strand repeat-containing protein [Promicromonospora thailandica]MCP2263154.1 putative adhesin [Promicromonospora thailandica]BFF18539.1 DUF4097 family beta strand repeat-containing protein [Promicromonospora thailandica]
MSADSWTVTGPQTIELDGVTTVDAHVVDGRLDVVAHDEPVVRVEVHSVEGRSLEVRLVDGRLVIEHESGLSGWGSFVKRFVDFGGKARADIHVAVPAGTVVRLGTVRGEGLLAGTTAGASASTVSGSLLVSRTAGDLRLNTVSGELTVRDHVGDITSNTVSADVVVSGSADVVTSSSVSGNVTLDLVTQPRQVRVNSVSGDMLLRVPDDRAVEVSVQSVSGRVTLGGLQFTGGGGSRVTGGERSGAPGVTQLRVTGVSGDVTVIGGPQDAPADATPDAPEDAAPTPVEL